MPTNHTPPLPVTWNQVAAFRLARHYLAQRAARESLLTVVGDMTGSQAQLLSAAQISLWARVNELRLTHIEKAISERRLVKASAMRRTLFLLPAEALAIFVKGSARRADKGIRWALGKGIPDRSLDAAIDATLDALDQPRTRREIAERVSRTLGVEMRAIQGGGWGSRRLVAAVPVGDLIFPVVDLLHLAAARGVFCYGPNRGTEPTFVRADAWIPGWQDLPTQQAEALLLRRYLRAFAPATVIDFALWSGITLTEARQIWAREQADLLSVEVEGWSASILRADLDALAQANFERPVVRLLPYFDSFLLGHKARTHLVEIDQQPKIYRPQGWIAPVVLVDGRVVAVWKYTQKGDHLAVEVTKFAELSPLIIDEIWEEAQALSRFLDAPNVDLQID